MRLKATSSFLISLLLSVLLLNAFAFIPIAYAQVIIQVDKNEVIVGEQVRITVFGEGNKPVTVEITPPNGTLITWNVILTSQGYYSTELRLDLEGTWRFRAIGPEGSYEVQVNARLPEYAESGSSWWDIYTKVVWGQVTWFWNVMSALWNGLTNSIDLTVNTIGGVSKAINASWTLITNVWGNWGDFATYNQVLTLNLMFPNVMLNMTSGATLSSVATTIIERCLKRGVAPPNFLNNWLNDNRTISEVTPTGFMGIINMFISFAIGSKDIVEWILRNFILLHLVAIVGLLVFGVFGAIKKRDFDPIVQSCHYIYGIFALYVKVITWIISKAIDLAQAIAQWLDTIIPF